MKKKVYFQNSQSEEQFIVGQLSKYEEIKTPLQIDSFVENYQKHYKLVTNNKVYKASLSKISSEQNYYLVERKADSIIIRPVNQFVLFTHHEKDEDDEAQKKNIENTLNLMKSRKLSAQKSQNEDSFTEESKGTLKRLSSKSDLGGKN